jgi:hypothetical protein
LCFAVSLVMDRRTPAAQGKPAVSSTDSELLWQALMREFEDATQEVLARLHAHELEGTPEAFDALMSAQLRRSRTLSDMLQFLDTLDDLGRRRPP